MEALGELHGYFFLVDPYWAVLAATILIPVVLGYFGAPLIVWSIYGFSAMLGWGAPVMALNIAAAVLVLFNFKPTRRFLISSLIMKVMKSILPQISDTEKEALEAGVVWSEAELFSGSPNFNTLMDQPYPQLTEEEKKFINGPIEEICDMANEWETWKNRELSPQLLQKIKDSGVLGMIIPKEYGGMAFSAMANSEIVQKVSSRNIAAGVTIMVPNSLGPAELLIHYGTEAQKKHWLPRLAKGDEIPCFGLTEPQAGSDAGSITSSGVLFQNEQGEICIKLNWKKRWITLAAISTVIGLAFRLRDPDNLLGRGEDLGITCALIPSNTPGVVVGRRHDPLGVPFYNCPTEGHEVVVKAEDAIIGGTGQAGKGWKMLMESLAAGRGISLPAQSVAGAKVAALVTSAHGTIRKQFGVSIAKFEGVEEPMARIGGAAYFMEATRRYTLSALDQGVKPPVVTAMVKYSMTEWGRKVMNDAMDVAGGAGISMGPRNTLAIPYIGLPIAITVEGANILTRTLIVFGQGALRAHPYAYKEVSAAETGDLKAFDEAFFGHIGHVVKNMIKSVVLSVTRGHIASRGYGHGTGRCFQKMAWASASFAITADLAMALLGGSLKFKEKITGRFADIMTYMYIGTAVLRRYQAEGYKKEDLPFVRYSMEVCFAEMQKAFDGIYKNLESPMLPWGARHIQKWLFASPLRWWSRLQSFGDLPSDDVTHKVVDLMIQDTEQRRRLFDGIYLPEDPEEQFGRLERAFRAIKKAESIERKIRKAVRKKELPKIKGPQLIKEALDKGVINEEEFQLVQKAEELRWDAIQVDDFSEEEYHQNKGVKSQVSDVPLDKLYGK